MLELLARVSLPAEESFLQLRSGQLSVGQGQRLLIALALLHAPRLIVADEPTSALDVITQQEILALFRRISDESGTAILFISHDLLSVAQICDRVAILYGERLSRLGPRLRCSNAPRHPYAQRLIGAIPRLALESRPAVAPRRSQPDPCPW